MFPLSGLYKAVSAHTFHIKKDLRAQRGLSHVPPHLAARRRLLGRTGIYYKELTLLYCTHNAEMFPSRRKNYSLAVTIF